MLYLSLLLAAIGVVLVLVARGKLADEDTKKTGQIMVAVGIVLLVVAAIGTWTS